MNGHFRSGKNVNGNRKRTRSALRIRELGIRRLVFESLEDRTLLAWVAQGPAPVSNGSNVDNVTPTNEVSGAVNAIAAHPTNADILYIGGANGGVWKTTNATATSPTWTPLTDNLTSQSIGALEFDPTDGTHNTLVAGTGRFSSLGNFGDDRSGILRTTNGGSTWTELSGAGTLNGKNISGVAARGSTIVVSVNIADSFSCGNIGIFRSTNTGSSFSQLTLAGSGMPRGTVFDLVGDPMSTSTLYAGVIFASTCESGGQNGIYKSTNTGQTWIKVSDSAMDTQINAITNTNGNIELSVGSNNNVYAAIVASSNGRLSGVFRSANGGTSWTQMALPTTNENGTIVGIHPGGQGGTHLSIVADPNDDNIVYIGGDRQPRTFGDTGNFPNSIGALSFSGRLFRGDASQASGSQWVHLTHSSSSGPSGGGTSNNSAPHADSREMVIDANGTLIQGDDGGIYRRTSPQNNTGSWQSLNANLQISEIHDIAYNSISNSILTGTQDNGTQQQPANGGPTWTSIFGGDGGDVAIDNVTNAASNQSIRYFSFQNLANFLRQVVTNTNTVVSTTSIGSGINTADKQFVTPIELNTINPLRILVGGLNNLYESSNQGTSFTNLGAPGANLNAMVYGGSSGGTPNADLIYVGKGSTVYTRTTSGGSITATSAFPSGGGDDVTDVAIDPDEWQTVFAIDNNQVFQSTNAGSSWTDVTGNLGIISSVGFRTIEFIPGTADAVVLGTRSGVYYAKLSAITTWDKLSTGMPNVSVFDLAYDQTDDVLVAGTLGRGAWLLADAETEINPGAELEAAGSVITTESLTPNNGFLDPGETVTVDFSLLNVGTADTTNLVATLLATGGVSAPSGAQNYGVVVAGGSAVTKSFTFTVANGIACGGSVTATLQLQDGAQDLGQVPFSFLCGPDPVVDTFSTGNISTTIPDPGTTDVNLVVTETGVITDVDVKIRLNHTWDDDLDIILVHPDGTEVLLSANNGGSSDNYGSGNNDCSGTPTIFDDDAATPITSGTAPFAGTFKPEGTLSSLNGKQANGTWKLRIIDEVSFDSGTVGCFQLVFSHQPTNCIASWDGGGSTSNWSEAANWLGDAVPQADSHVQLSATSTEDSTVDASFAGTVGSVTVAAGYTGTLTLARTLTAGSFTGNLGNVDLGGNTLTTGSDNTHTNFDGAVSGSGGLVKNGTGSYYLRGVNSYTGVTTINDGSILVSQNDGLGTTAGGTTVSPGATARLVFERSVNYTTLEPVTINGTGYNNNGSLIGVGNSTFAGPVTLGSASTIAAAPAGYTFTLNGTINNAGNPLTMKGTGNTIVGGEISGSGGLTKEGPGTVTLSTANSYAGATTVNGGTLLVAGSISSAVTVNAGGTLGGGGTVGAITTASSGIVAPGSSIGVLSGSSADFSAGGVLRLQIQGYTSAGTNFDQLIVSGELALGSSATLSLDLAGLSTTGIAAGAITFGSKTGSFLSTIELLNNNNGYKACLTDNGNSYSITIAVPGACGSWTTGSGEVGAVGALDAMLVATQGLAARSQAVTVASLDTGVDYSHPALYANIWINQAEIPAEVRRKLADVDRDGRITLRDLNHVRNQGQSKISDLDRNGTIDGGDLLAAWSDGQDTDGNGYVDDLIGWDFVNNDNDPRDDSGHGTHAAGVMVLVAPRVEVMVLKFLDEDAIGKLSDASRALDYALAQNVTISSNGWAANEFSQEWLDKLTDAEAAGHFFITAAGNGDPAQLEILGRLGPSNLLVVGAQDAKGELASFSNWDPEIVDVLAPGVGVLSTMPGGGYAEHSGTSVSTAFVAGLAALRKGSDGRISRAELFDAVITDLQFTLELHRLNPRLESLLALAADVYFREWIRDRSKSESADAIESLQTRSGSLVFDTIAQVSASQRSRN